MPTAFSDLLARVRATPATHALELPSDWGQGRSTFGGLIVAFRLTPRDAGVVAGAHFGLALLIAMGSMLSAAISSGAGAAAGAAG